MRRKKKAVAKKPVEKKIRKKLSVSARARKVAEVVVSVLNKKYKGEIVTTGDKAIQYGRVPTGSKMLDAILGGGFPMGKVIEFHGPFGCGKSTMLLLSIAKQQVQGLVCAYVDTEKSFDKAYAKTLGVDLESLILLQIGEQEEVIDVLHTLALNGRVNVIYLDSVQGMIPKAVDERSAFDATMGIEAKLNNLLMRKMIHAMSNMGEAPHCCLVIVSQDRAVIGVRSKFPIPPKPGGGMGVEFFKHVSVRLRRGDKLGSDGDKVKQHQPVCGIEILFYTEKNKTFAPFLSGFCSYFFKHAPEANIKAGSIDTVKELVTLGRQTKAISQAGAFYTFDGQKFRGEVALTAYVRDMESTAGLEGAIIERLKYGEGDEGREEGGEVVEGEETTG